MKVAVISDIHGNLEAFTEVLADIDRAGADSIVCLGDLIGYGPNPEEVVRLLRSRSIPSVMGNHELVLASWDFLDWFNETARESLVLSQGLISAGTRVAQSAAPYVGFGWRSFCSRLPSEVHLGLYLRTGR